MHKMCAGIVLYNPDMRRLQKNIEAIKNQVDKVYIVDNGSTNIDTVRFCCKQDKRIELIENGINKGIAAALNMLLLKAEENGFDWMVTLDQDSVADPDMVEKFKPYVEENIAILCPLIVDDNEKNLIRSNVLPDVIEVERAITSGGLTNVFVWRKIGGFDEAMFIDCVDFDYCTNAVLNGYKILQIPAAKLHHRLGEAKEVRSFIKIAGALGINKFKKPVFTYNHSLERTYYYARNIHYYMKKYRGKINIKTERMVYLKWFILKVFFEQYGLKKLGAIIRGTRDSKALYKLYKAKQGKK